MNYKISILKNIDEEQLLEINELCRECFDEFVGVEYSQKGRDTFYTFSSVENLKKLINFGELLIMAKFEDELSGFICSAKGKKHIALLFVKKKYHRQGIAKSLLAAFLDEINEQSLKKTKEITVNSSPYAVQAYEKLGFVAIGEKTKGEDSGIIAIPMKYVIK